MRACPPARSLAGAAVLCVCFSSSAQAATLGDEAGVRFGPWSALVPLELPAESVNLDKAGPVERELRHLARGRLLDLERDYPRKGGGKVAWTAVPVAGDAGALDVGQINLLALAPGASQAMAYLYRTLEVDATTDLVVAVGSDDALRMWLDGEVVLNRPVLRGTTPYDDRVVLHLEPGTHTLLAKVTQETGGFGFRMAKPHGPSQQAIDEAIQRAVDFLLSMQMVDGSWGLHEAYGGGNATLGAYALSQSGLPNDHPAIRMALEHARERRADLTYAAACDAFALARVADGAEDEAWYAERVEQLIAWQDSTGLYAYPPNPHVGTKHADMSNTIFAAYALRLAAHAGHEIPGKLWSRLIKGTLDCLKDPKRSVGAKGGEVEAAGFSYTPQSGPTTALTLGALAVQAIAVEELGRELSPRQHDQVLDAREAGLAWLGQHFTWTRNSPPAHRKMYAIYGMERLGSLLGREELLGRPWFLDGAQFLIEGEDPKGGWRFEEAPIDTMLGLLFLNRATASSGVSRPSLRGYTTGEEDAEVRLAANGDSPFTVWVEGLAKEVSERLERAPGEGPLVREVRYLARALDLPVEQEPWELASVAGDDAPLAAQRFAIQHEFERRGRYEVWAEVEALPAAAAPVTLVSPPLTVLIHQVLVDGQLEYAAHGGLNLFKGAEYDLIASSHNELETPALAFDGTHTTRWSALASDAQPTLSVGLARAARASRLVLSHGRPWRAAAAPLLPARVRLVVNQRETIEVDVDPDPILKTALIFSKPVAVKSLELTVLSTTGAAAGEAGVSFSEIELLP